MSQKFIKKKLTSPEYTTSTQNGTTRASVAMLEDISFEEATDYTAPQEQTPAEP